MWFDSDLPLQYLFGYIDPSTTKQLSISTESTAQSVSSCLPSGREASSYVLNTTLVVSDALSSYSSIFFATVVRPSSNSALLVNSTSTLSLNMINVIGSFLNKVNCTGISNCVKLNRHDCSNVDFTCGDCFPDYIGESGPHNSMCVKSSSNFNGEDPSSVVQILIVVLSKFARVNRKGAFCPPKNALILVPPEEIVLLLVETMEPLLQSARFLLQIVTRSVLVMQDTQGRRVLSLLRN